jgi:DNA-directed RNA polymerase specialized sigma24 family protein
VTASECNPRRPATRLKRDICRPARGNRDARREQEFGDYVVARSRRLCEFAYLLCGDWHAAEDAVQTALAKLFVAWRRLRERESMDA